MKKISRCYDIGEPLEIIENIFCYDDESVILSIDARNKKTWDFKGLFLELL